uniref:Solute carrier family 12 member 3 n=1 Tax=Acrobeloides nanus TaxID=290746 RepID=A0A914CBT2_9BILA
MDSRAQESHARTRPTAIKRIFFVEKVEEIEDNQDDDLDLHVDSEEATTHHFENVADSGIHSPYPAWEARETNTDENFTEIPIERIDPPESTSTVKNVIKETPFKNPPALRELSALDFYPSEDPNKSHKSPKKEKSVKQAPSSFKERFNTQVKNLENFVTRKKDKPNVQQSQVASGMNQTFEQDLEEHQYTLERPPTLEFYNTNLRSSRPRLSVLIGNKPLDEKEMKDFVDDLKATPSPDGDPEKGPTTNKKGPGEKKLLGWIEGVLVRCISNILGVMLYMRIGWMAGQAGLLWGSIIILVASAITMITALSMSAICTNGIISGGGIYYLISRALGPQFGGSIGIVFSIANGFGAAMYFVGLAETIRDILKEYGWCIINCGINDVRLLALIMCTLMILVVFAGTNFESKTQVIFVVLVLISVVDYYVGTVAPISENQALKGMTGYSLATLKENFLPDFRQGYNVIAVFAVFFPAATGIMAGANISGDLKDAGRAIPLGTIIAIGITSGIYMSFLWMTGSMVVRDADGINPPMLNNDSNVPGYYVKPPCALNYTCPYGLMNYFQIVNLSSLFGPFITLGLVVSALSSALTSLVSAPKLFQAVCKDKLFPYIGYFAKGYGPNNEPRKAYVMVYLLACGIILIGDLNAIAPFITNFFLCTYALVNYACFDCSYTKSPSFRPSFKYYNMYISLLGAVLCLMSMFLISWETTVNFGGTDQVHTYRSALTYVRKLDHLQEHVKTYRPQILVLTGNAASRPALVDFAYSITKKDSLLICGYVVQADKGANNLGMVKSINHAIRDWLKLRKVKAFNVTIADQNLRHGARTLIQTTGLGRFKPNIVLLGFKQNLAANITETNDYFGVIKDSFDANLSVCIFRNSNNNLDLTDLMVKHNLNGTKDDQNKSQDEWLDKRKEKVKELMKKALYGKEESSGRLSRSSSQRNISGELTGEQKLIISKINQFRTKVKRALIDVWWLYDDGGLTLFIPHLLTQPKSFLEGAKLRIFTLAKRAGVLDEEQRNFKALLKKFRINFSDVNVFSYPTQRNEQRSISAFNSLIAPFRSASNKNQPGMISDEELKAHEHRTSRHIRIGDLMKQNSSAANLVVATLPVPKKNLSSTLYMAWLDYMTRELPPTLLVRGNHTSVLTFYS